MLGEPFFEPTYVSVFITHFLSSPIKNYGILRKLYLEQDLTQVQIAEISGWSRTSVLDALKQLQLIKIHHKSSQLRYGERRVAGISRPNKAERKTIDLMLVMKSDGLTYSKIAFNLNKKNIPSKRQGSWSPTAVQNIIEREQNNNNDVSNESSC